MKLIDEMREKAESFRETSPYDYGYIADQIRDWADRLAASGALVPVPQGEVGYWTGCGTDDFIKDGVVYCYINGVDRHLNIKSRRTYLVEDNDMVQPVALVPIAEAEV